MNSLDLSYPNFNQIKWLHSIVHTPPSRARPRCPSHPSPYHAGGQRQGQRGHRRATGTRGTCRRHHFIDGCSRPNIGTLHRRSSAQHWPAATDVADTVCFECIPSLSQKSDNAADAATKDKPPNGAETEAARKEREAQQSKTSLTPVLQRLSALRAAVQVAVAARQQMVAQAERDEQAVSAEDRSALEERHSMLVMEVHMKDEKIKILIDQLRELHRDIVILLASYFKHLSAQRRT